MSAVLDFLAVFVHSDVAGPSPDWWHWINAQCSHTLIGAVFGAFAPKYWRFFIAAWIAKEGLGDIRNSGWDAFVIGDSLSDLLVAHFGYWVFNTKLMRLNKSPEL